MMSRISDETTLERVRNTRRVPIPWADDPGRGMTTARLDRLLERWATGYDATARRRRVDDLPWRTIGTGERALRVVHRPAADPGAPVVVLLHGWPDSVLRFERLLPLLPDVHVVVPALPGFPFAAPVADRGALSTDAMADAVAAVLDELGHERYVVSGGDVGGTVAEVLAGRHAGRVAALHLTNIAPRRALTVDRATVPADAVDWLDRSAGWFRTEGGYIAIQSSRPTTVATALGDSPAGLAAWIGEKLLDWSDDGAFTDDDLLDWITVYWDSGAIGTSLATYVEPVTVPDRLNVPTVFSRFPGDLKPEPRSYVEQFVDLRHYVEHDAGGHFAAWEVPEDYAADLRLALTLG